MLVNKHNRKHRAKIKAEHVHHFAIGKVKKIEHGKKLIVVCYSLEIEDFEQYKNECMELAKRTARKKGYTKYLGCTPVEILEMCIQRKTFIYSK